MGTLFAVEKQNQLKHLPIYALQAIGFFVGITFI